MQCVDRDVGFLEAWVSVFDGVAPSALRVSCGKRVQLPLNYNGCLSMGRGDYLQPLDWTGRQIRREKRGSLPANLETLFERLGISTKSLAPGVGATLGQDNELGLNL